MAEKRQSAAQTLKEIMGWRPAFASVLQAFEPILSAQEEAASALCACAKDSGLSLPPVQNNRLEQGVSLLMGESLTGTAPTVQYCADRLLPLLSSLDALAAQATSLSTFFAHCHEGDGQISDTLVNAVAGNDEDALSSLARAEGVEPSLLGFTAGFVVGPVLHALVVNSFVDGAALWEGIWRQGYCPVCGALPTISWLDKRVVDEKNAFLVGGGGKKHLHCFVCGADWTFRRGACPACGKEGSGVLEFLRESGTSHGERVEWCTSCKGYLPNVDLREREFVPHLDALALGMMHLDMVAARNKLRPLHPTFWNIPS